MEPRSREIQDYETATGKAPFREWLLGLRDASIKIAIVTRLKRVAFGNFGDCRYVGQGVYELRIHRGPGFRVYFGEDQGVLIILLCGGDKNTQTKDIPRAQLYWADYRGRQ